jgi:hypothetical protein
MKVMRICLLILMLCAAGLKGLASRPVTAEQVESLVAAAQGKSDAQAASEIASLELTERLSSARFTRCLAHLPGNRAKEALMALADVSAFLDLPLSDIPVMEKPDLASQHQMIAFTVNYVNKTLHELPNFYATRVTTSFREDMRTHNSLRRVGRYSDMELYRNGEARLRTSRRQSRAAELITSGEFGPILGTAMLDAARGNLTWSHWEQGETGPVAVYRYTVSEKESHYVVRDRRSAYQGEITIDPSSGVIHRIVLRTGLDPTEFFLANMVVEYGLVELGGKNYICPLRSVAFSGSLPLMWLNDVVFEKYHLFRPTMRILPGFNEVH